MLIALLKKKFSVQQIIFTDLDGTLLDHVSYEFAPAMPALQAIKERGIPLILASSKTAAEVAAIRSALGTENWPAIVENGAGELAPCSNSTTDPNFVTAVNSTTGPVEYKKLRALLNQLPAPMRRLFRGFGDMNTTEVADVTGLSISAARLAKDRAYTEPGTFTGNQEEKEAFRAALAELAISMADGGRFLTLSFGRTKADALKEIAKRMKAHETIALGDAPNDRDMLLAANRAIIVRNDHAPKMGDIPGAVKTRLTGPAGWNEAVLALLYSIPKKQVE